MVKHVDDDEDDDDNSDDEMTLGELHFTCRHELWHCFAVGLMMVPILMMEPMMDTDDADLNLVVAKGGKDRSHTRFKDSTRGISKLFRNTVIIVNYLDLRIFDLDE